MSRRGRPLALLAGSILALATAGSAWAFEALPLAGQVNDDPAAGIESTRGVSGEDPANADVAGGALTAGSAAVPWAIFRGLTVAHDQVFSRSFAAGAWQTRGSGTVGGRSSASPTFAGSLNFDQGQDGEAPAIDFAGAGRTVPWATWYEETPGAGFGSDNVFASRFDNSGDANQGKWIFAGQSRGMGGGSVPVPSLNIHTNQDAENPSVAGGSTSDPAKPGPWITWQETSTAAGNPDQIFVVKPVGPGAVNCDGVTPAGVNAGSGIPSIGGFCWQQTGIDRYGSGTLDPSLNIDPTRNGIEPDIAFTGPQDSVPWVVWYELDNTGTTGPNALQSNSMVFAAKGVADGSADGATQWQAVGTQLSGALDTSGANSFGACGANAANEVGCSLDKTTSEDAEDPRVAAGTMSPGSPAVPWVAWDEGPHNGTKQVFVSRLVGAGAGAHFELVNNGAPISTGAGSSTRPDITFSGNTPYVSWREDTGAGVERAFVGHFVGASNPTFVLDESDVPLTPSAQADVREPLSSSCTANPFNQDGAACQGGALGTPFFLFTNGTSTRGLFADAYQPDTPLTDAASAVSASSASVSGSVNPEGAAVSVSFQYGTTTGYGQSTAAQPSAVPPNGPPDTATPFSATLSGLPSGTTIHYRAVAVSDFGTFTGPDQTLSTLSPSTPSLLLTSPPQPLLGEGATTVAHAKVSGGGTSAGVRLACQGAATATCRLTLALEVTETLRGHRVIAVSARKNRLTRKVVILASTSVKLSAGQSEAVDLELNRTGKRLLASRRVLKAKLVVLQTLAGGRTKSVSTQIVTLKAPRHKRG